MSRNTNVDLSLAKYSVGKVKSKNFAWAGLMLAMKQIDLDSNDEVSKQSDNLFYCGLIADEEHSPDALFKNVSIGNGRFDVAFEDPQDIDQQSNEVNQRHQSKNESVTNYQIDLEGVRYGFTDEERKINLNALSVQTVDILISLLEILEIPEEEAQAIAYSIVDWVDADQVLSDLNFGAENDYYEGLVTSYRTKNSPLDSKEELMLVRGVTPEVFQKMEPYITIFPKQDSFRINIDTASKIVLQALANSMSGDRTNTDESDATSLIDKMLTQRAGNDGIEFSQDDQVIDLNEMELNAKERTLFLAVNQFRVTASNYFYIRSRGQEFSSGVSTIIEAVVQRDNLIILYWRST